MQQHVDTRQMMQRLLRVGQLLSDVATEGELAKIRMASQGPRSQARHGRDLGRYLRRDEATASD